MIESSGNVAILKTINSIEIWMGSKIILFAYEFQWGWNHSQTSFKQLMVMLKNLSKRIENER